jgi:hypothetical protein
MAKRRERKMKARKKKKHLNEEEKLKRKLCQSRTA